jgi:hypothetical protein
MRHPSTSWPGLSRPSTRRRCKQRLKLPMASGLGCPAQGDGCPVQQKSPVTRENLGETAPLGGLAGLVPAIPRRMRSIRPHAAPLQETFEVGGFRSAWMPGTSPGRTRQGCVRLELRTRSCRTGQPWDKPGMTSKGSTQPNYISDSATFRFPRTVLPAAGRGAP